jgi:DNA-binding response OmpR family regulator
MADNGAAAHSPDSASKPVLLVDDSTDTLEMYRIGLAMAGFRALVARDAATALRELQRERPVAVVTDLELGAGRDGWQLVEDIRNDPATRQVPVVVLTGRVDPDVQLDAQRAGCAALVCKPCLPNELARVIDCVSSRTGTPGRTVDIQRSDRRRHRRGEAGAEPQRKLLDAMILGMFREMPGLSLHLHQAARLFGLREQTCRIVLDDLVRAGRLRRSADGQYITSGAVR